jgi:nicotinamidase/pyrazinamidase
MKTSVAVVIDMQNDFMPGGALPVPRGREIIPNILKELPKFDMVVFTQDCHPKGHISFASSYDDKKPFDTIRIGNKHYKLWPDHCIQGEPGSQIVSELQAFPGHFFYKGTAWHDAGYSDPDLASRIKRRIPLEFSGEPLDIVIMGVATEYCVMNTTLDFLRYKDFIHSLSVQLSCIAPVDEIHGETGLEILKTCGVHLIP